MSPSLTTREATRNDEAFLYALFKAVRSPEFAHAPLDPAQLELLLSLQFSGQKMTYGTQYPDGDCIILLDGGPIGRIWVFPGSGEHRLVDISLLPEFQNRGFGSALLTEAIAAARAAGVPLRCSVSVANHGSLRFHQRLGFQIVDRDVTDVHLAVGP